jgi:CheY-like chemotaxis protein
MQSMATCFLIDDDIDDQEIFIMALKDIGKAIQCVTANDGKEALKKLVNNTGFVPDYIFMDLNMPGMSGKQCLTAIRKIDHLSRVPVIIYSTSSDQRDILETRQLGANDYVIKQAGLTALKSTLQQVFQKHNSV